MGQLYLVATPIGNLKDITIRAIEMLESSDIIAAEDTRQTLKLLNHLGIKKPLISYHEHNKKFSGDKLIEKLKEGNTIALVSDAGTPGISDPGEDIVKLCIEEG
ncbi:MAG: SAM-dependent methyltransferase, partial [Clostridium sp.]